MNLLTSIADTFKLNMNTFQIFMETENIEKTIKYMKRNEKKLIIICIKNYYKNMYLTLYRRNELYQIFKKQFNECIRELERREVEEMILDTTQI